MVRSVSNSQVYNPVLLTIVIRMYQYIKSPELIHLITGSLTTFTPHAHTWQPPIYSLSMSSVFSDSTCKWDHTVFVFLCLTYFLSIMPSRLIRVVTNGRNFFFLWLNNIPLCMYMYILYFLYPFIHQWTFRLFPYLGYCE